MEQITEQEYFNQTVQKVLTQIDCIMDINITILDHDTLTGKHKNALGICYRDDNDNYQITIDEFFVQECYKYFVLNQYWNTWELDGKTLEEIICHELAHVQEWRHGKKHTQLTRELLSMVELPKKYYQYLNKQSITA